MLKNTFLTMCFIQGFKSSCPPPGEPGNFESLDNMHSINSDDSHHHHHQFLSNHFPTEEQEYHSLEPGNQSQAYIDSSPEFFPANNLIESKYHPHNYVKNYVRGKLFFNEIFFLNVLFILNLTAPIKIFTIKYLVVNDGCDD